MVLDAFVVMPNHVHGIIVIQDILVGVGSESAPTAKRIDSLWGTLGAPLWQRNYYEHIIWDKNEMNRIRQYIRDNPKNWNSDKNYWWG